MLGFYKLSFGLLPDSVTQAKNQLAEESIKYGELDLSSINLVDFPDDQYYREITDKNQIIIHHTVSGDGVMGDINWWKMTKDRISTHVIIGRDGKIYQCYSSKYWGHHIGIQKKYLMNYGFTDWKTRNVLLNKKSIGIEIDSWGGLVKYDEKFYPAKYDKITNTHIPNLDIKPIPKKNVITYEKGYRGFNYYEKYTNSQLKSLAELLKFWNKTYKIPLNYNSDMWDVSENALNGTSGVWSHTSFRADKSDAHPQKNLINLLRSLNK